MPSHIISMTPNGIQCTVGQRRVMLDPKTTDPRAINFVSHAHTDHLPAKNGSAGATVLASEPTREIARLRGFDLCSVDHADGFEMIDSGHILGSKGLFFDEIFYTGDICTRDRGFLRGARVPKCRILVTESTFGLPEFSFPDTRDVVVRVNRIISDLYGRGVPVILMGYQLGKAQILTRLFGHWMPLYLDDSILAMNGLHEKLGVDLADGIGCKEAESRGLLEQKPWLMITPLLSEKTAFVQRMKSKYGAVTVGFSGWARYTKFSFGRRADHSIPMSDHCDYAELVKMVRMSGAEMVYTTHGFESEFAGALRDIGIDAAPLGGKNGRAS